MSTFTVDPRVEFDTAGYVRLRCCEQGTEYCVYLHRLTAYAHEELDDLWSAEHVHHRDADPWNNHPDNLEALTPDEHAEREPHVANFNL